MGCVTALGQARLSAVGWVERSEAQPTEAQAETEDLGRPSSAQPHLV